MDSDALIKLQDVVDRYVFRRKIPSDDWALYLEHAADCVRELNTHHLRAFKTAQIDMPTKGIVDMPRDCIDIIAVATPWNGKLWTLTKENYLDITTMEGWPQNNIKPDLQWEANFLDRESVEREGGEIDASVTFSSGKAVLDGTSGNIKYKRALSGTYTIVIKLTPDNESPSTEYLIDFTTNSGTGTLTRNAGAISASSGTTYVNGSAGSSVGAAASYIVVSGMTIDCEEIVIGSDSSDANLFDGVIDYVQIYDRTWSAADVTAGYADDAAISETDQDSMMEPLVTEYGAIGANNTYYYYPDWKRRKIYLNGIPTETTILTYISSGLSLTGDTYIPSHAMQVIDRYLRWMQAEIDGAGINERRDRERLYGDAIMMLRRTQLPSLDEFRDTMLSITTQSIIR